LAISKAFPHKGLVAMNEHQKICTNQCTIIFQKHCFDGMYQSQQIVIWYIEYNNGIGLIFVIVVAY